MRTCLIALLAFVLGFAFAVGVYVAETAWLTHGITSAQRPAAHLRPKPATTASSASNGKPLLAEAPPSLLPDQGWPRDAPTPNRSWLRNPVYWIASWRN